jgi:coenzyme PQQ synthesis protein D (PqqD)
VAGRSDIRYACGRLVFAARLWSKTALNVTIDSVLVRESELKAAELDGSIVLLSVRAGAYFSFNRVASEIWTILAEPCRVGGIFDRLVQSHEVDAQTLARDVTPFLQELLAHRLVRLIDPAQGR